MSQSPIVAAPIAPKQSELDALDSTLRTLIEQKDAATRAELGTKTTQLETDVANITAPTSANAFERYTFSRSEGISSTTNTNWQTKLNLNGFELPLGTYRIGWKYSYNSITNKSDFRARLLMNGQEIFLHEQELTEKSSKFLKDQSGQRQVASGFDVIENLSGTVDFDLQWATEHKKYAASIWGAVLELRRVG